ncbi:MAG TPA: hypothetical protein PKN76_08020 [bacterium]|nr:hypothetical protein [bacterium]HNZ54070.1 hypothetical protein [bacterium]HOG43804.1 hypothetical protein [bacterium]HPV21677.1 hypothetical protein [bacterium]
MGHISKRKSILFVIVFLTNGFLLGEGYFNPDNDPIWSDTSFGVRARELSHSIDTQNCGKGCGALLSHNSQYLFNPANAMLQQQFTLSLLYHYLDSMSASVSDSKTSKVAGGVMYSRHAGLNHIKTNFAFPIYKIVFGGLNVNNYIGKFAPTQTRSTNSHSFDLGISAVITKFLYVGFGALDVWTFSGKDIPRKLNWQFELNFNNMFFFNNGWQYHLEPEKEKFPNKRSKLKDFDFYTGFEFRYSWFRAAIGFNNLSFSEDFTWDTTLKTFSIALYKPGAGGIYGSFMYNEAEYMTFTINIVWEPPVQ